MDHRGQPLDDPSFRVQSRGMKMLNGKGKGYRKGVKCAASKRLNPRTIASKKEEISPVTVDPCDNSNDSGLGFDHFDLPNPRPPYADQEFCWGSEEGAKKRRYDFKHESDNANDNFIFTRVTQRQQPTQLPICLRGKGASVVGRAVAKGTKAQGVGSTQGLSRNGKVHLEILSQPEMQHRARYQTEGSRGAVKDRTGNSFPIVKLSGYKKTATLEVYIGTDQGRVAPHMFYQACRVSGKNSTPCIEKKVEGTVLIEIEMDPSKEMTVTCDCVGILKERNVDVEHRFPEESSGRSKKKSTRCRMVFRTNITNEDGTVETLQVTSQPIICTQPPGIPEICKKSLTACPASGGLELFILGKNFLKDTRVVFSEGEPGSDMYWESVVQPDKEFLQQSHLVCAVPPYRDEALREMVAVQLMVTSSGRSSEPHTFVYTPLNALPMDPNTATRAPPQSLIPNAVFGNQNVFVGVPWHVPVQPASFIQDESTKMVGDEKGESEMMPPPATVPPVRRSEVVKREAESPPCLAAAIQEFVTTETTPLPSLQVENYLSRIESPPQTPTKPDLIPIAHLASQPTSPQVILQPKLAGLLGENSELLYPSGESIPAGVGSVLLETGGREFAQVEGAQGEFNRGMMFAPENLASTAPLSLTPTTMAQSVTPLSPVAALSLAPAAPLSLAPAVPLSLASSLTQATPLSLPSTLTQAAPLSLSQTVPLSLSQTSSLSMPRTTPLSMPQTASLSLAQASTLSMPQTASLSLAQASALSMPQTAPLTMPQTASLSLAQASALAMPQTAPLTMPQTAPLSLAQTAPLAMPQTAPLSALSPTANPPQPFLLPELVSPKVTLPIPQKKCEEGIPLPQELTQMSEHDLLSYINPSCFDQGNQSTFSQFFI